MMPSKIDLKNRFDAVAGMLWLAREELERLSGSVELEVDKKAIKSLITDLSWASENCTVLGLHQVGEALNDTMGQ